MSDPQQQRRRAYERVIAETAEILRKSSPDLWSAKDVAALTQEWRRRLFGEEEQQALLNGNARQQAALGNVGPYGASIGSRTISQTHRANEATVTPMLRNSAAFSGSYARFVACGNILKFVPHYHRMKGDNSCESLSSPIFTYDRVSCASLSAAFRILIQRILHRYALMLERRVQNRHGALPAAPTKRVPVSSLSLRGNRAAKAPRLEDKPVDETAVLPLMDVAAKSSSSNSVASSQPPPVGGGVRRSTPTTTTAGPKGAKKGPVKKKQESDDESSSSEEDFGAHFQNAKKSNAATPKKEPTNFEYSKTAASSKLADFLEQHGGGEDAEDGEDSELPDDLLDGDDLVLAEFASGEPRAVLVAELGRLQKGAKVWKLSLRSGFVRLSDNDETSDNAEKGPTEILFRSGTASFQIEGF